MLEAYEVILKNIPETDNLDRLDYMKSMADYCLKHGRVEQATVIYQKANKICMMENLGAEYKQIKEILNKIPG